MHGFQGKLIRHERCLLDRQVWLEDRIETFRIELKGF
jgi:hypothetical protein